MKANPALKMPVQYFRDAQEFYHFCKRRVQVKYQINRISLSAIVFSESGPSPDLKNENLRLFITLMLQQAQEVIVIKSIRDGMSAKEGFDNIIKNISIGIA